MSAWVKSLGLPEVAANVLIILLVAILGLAILYKQ
jgi:hypothetical protein